MASTNPLIVSLKQGIVGKNANVLQQCFRQIEIWSQIISGIPLLTTNLASSQTVATNTDTLTHFTAVSDPLNMFNDSTYQATIPGGCGGVWQVSVTTSWAGTPSGQCFNGLWVNSGPPSLTQYPGTRYPMGAYQGASFNQAITVKTGDTVSVDTWQDSGSTQTLAYTSGGSGAAASFFSMFYLGPA